MIFPKGIGPDMFSWSRHYVVEVCMLPSSLLVSAFFVLFHNKPNKYIWGYQNIFLFQQFSGRNGVLFEKSARVPIFLRPHHQVTTMLLKTPHHHVTTMLLKTPHHHVTTMLLRTPHLHIIQNNSHCAIQNTPPHVARERETDLF